MADGTSASPPTLRPRRSSRAEELLSNARMTLAVASDLAPLVPVPVLYSIFTAARDVVDIAIVGDVSSIKVGTPHSNV